MTVPEHDLHRLEVLVLWADRTPMQALLSGLRVEGVQIDTASDLQGARNSFFRSGGHGCLVIGPDVPPGLANKVAGSLQAIDPDLAMATFGPDLNDRGLVRTAKLKGFHPGSRAGVGALLRFLRTL